MKMWLTGKKMLDELQALLPAMTWRRIAESKLDVKEQFARALNYVLPSFDLVVIDEAHNFKHDFESSHRNSVLSRVLGLRDKQGLPNRIRVDRALLLSATPYDRVLEQPAKPASTGRQGLAPTR